VKTLNGLYISVLIALLVFFIKPVRVDVRFGTGVGAVFAAIASKYVIASSLQENGQLMLVDEIYALTTSVIFLSLLESAFALHLHDNDRPEAAKRLDRFSFWFLAAVYLAANVYLIW
jgi:hypothetical protein